VPTLGQETGLPDAQLPQRLSPGLAVGAFVELTSDASKKIQMDWVVQLAPQVLPEGPRTKFKAWAVVQLGREEELLQQIEGG